VAATRWPLCPVNGAILSVPVEVTDRDDAAQQWGLVAREDLARTEAALKLRFPVFALVGGVEALPGGATFFERFAVEKGSQRLGKGFPLNPDVRPGDVGEEVEKSVRWIFGSLLPYWVFKLMRSDGGTGGESRDNAGLFRFMVELRRRAPRLGRLMSRALAVRDDQLPVFGGSYLAVALYADPNDPKFAREFFRKVEAAQGAVAWTEAAYDEDANYRSATRTGYAVLTLIGLGVLALAGYVGYVQFYKPR
jgi:type VI protein secretion system component VasK